MRRYKENCMQDNQTAQLGNFLIQKKRFDVKTSAFAFGLAKEYVEYENEDCPNEDYVINIRTVSGNWNMSYTMSNPLFALINEIIPDNFSPDNTTDEIKGLQTFLTNAYLSANYLDPELTKKQLNLISKQLNKTTQKTLTTEQDLNILQQLQTAHEIEQNLTQKHPKNNYTPNYQQNE